MRRELRRCYGDTWRQLLKSLSNTEFLRSPAGQEDAPVSRVQEFLDAHPLLVPWDEDGEPWKSDGSTAVVPHLSWIFQYGFEQPADELKLKAFLAEERRRFRHAYRHGGEDTRMITSRMRDVPDVLAAMGRTTQLMQYRLRTWFVDEVDPETGERIVLHGGFCPGAGLNCWTFTAYFTRLLQYAGFPAERLHFSSHSWLGLRYRATTLMVDHEARQYTTLPLMGIMSQNVIQAAVLDSADQWLQGFGFFPDYAPSYFVEDGYFFDGQSCLRLHEEDGRRRLLPPFTPSTRPTFSCSDDGPGEIVSWNPREWNLLETNNMTTDSLTEHGEDLSVESMLPEPVAEMSALCVSSERRREYMREWLEDYFGAVDAFEEYTGRPATEPSRVSQAIEVLESQ